jgi:hypothetical protein
MSQEWKEPAAGEDVQMPLGVGGDAAPVEEYSPARPRINTSTVALIASFVAALAVLYFMGLQNKPRAASGSDPTRIKEIDERIKNWLEDKVGRQSAMRTSDQLLQKLREYMDGTKVDVMDPGANAFQHAEVEVAKGPTTLPELVIFTPELPPEKQDPGLIEVAKTLPGLKLQMVIVGNPSSAMINNQMASVGSKFGLLAVTEIQNDRVLLTYEGTGGKKYVFPLYISGSSADPNAGFGGSRPK